MAKSPTKPEASTEAAYAAAASKAPAKKPAKPAVRKPAPKPVATKAVAPEPVLAKVEEALPPVAEAVVPEVIAAEPEPVAEPAPIVAEDISIAPAEVDAVATPINAPFQFLKDLPMTNDFTATFTDTMTGAVNEVQARLQSAYDKSTTVVTEMTDLAKGNVEALVESSKLVAAGVQDMGKTYADEAKAAYETATADMKEMAAIKSPTELFQLQGKIVRRNFDMFIAATSKSTDAALKLANDAMAPISGRVNVTAEKLSQVAA